MFMLLFYLQERSVVAVQDTFQADVNDKRSVRSLELASSVSQAHALDNVSTILLNK